MFNPKRLLVSASTDFPTPQPADFSKESMTQAFLHMQEKMAAEYAFTQHKDINWLQLKNKYLPLIESAEKNNDQESYYKALRGYMLELHDTHSVILGDNAAAEKFVTSLVKKSTGASYGLIISNTDDCKYIASYIHPGSSAAKAGIALGAEIIEWNNQPIAEAVLNANILMSDDLDPSISYSPSTQASLNYEKLRMLVRGAVGAKANIRWCNPGLHEVKDASLIAEDDGGVIAKKTELFVDTLTFDTKSDPSKQILLQELPNGYLHLIIVNLSDGAFSATDKNPKDSDLYKYFVKIMQVIQDKNPPGVIVDLRGNTGGDGRLGIDFAGFFTPNPTPDFAVHMTIYDTTTKNYQRAPLKPNVVSYQTPHYSGRMVVLTDIGTLSAAEWAALSFQRIGKKILSFYPNTQGAFAGSEPLIKMPGDFDIMYSMMRAYDQNDRLLGDSNARLQGGIKTDKHIPFDAKTAIAIYTNGEDPALNFALAHLKAEAQSIPTISNEGNSNKTSSLTTKQNSQDVKAADECNLGGWVKDISDITTNLWSNFSICCCGESFCEEQPENTIQTDATLLGKKCVPS